ncbi:MAG: Sua5/YciO/YrdC/YwlC family protein, partial [Pseudomonadota bacterium]
MSQRVSWQEHSGDEVIAQAADLLAEGKMIVSPTKVGYIIMASNEEGLRRKFDAKQRAMNKPAVVLCGSMEQLTSLAVMSPEVEAFYQMHWDQDVLMGCIMPWKEEALAKIPEDIRPMVSDPRKTSCFVIKFGIPSERIAAR